jgi:hypothetical protein
MEPGREERKDKGTILMGEWGNGEWVSDGMGE